MPGFCGWKPPLINRKFLRSTALRATTKLRAGPKRVLIDEVLIVELKAVEKVLPIHKAQLLSYMKLLNKPLGLHINFHELVLRNGIYRMILKGGDSL